MEISSLLASFMVDYCLLKGHGATHENETFPRSAYMIEKKTLKLLLGFFFL